MPIQNDIIGDAPNPPHTNEIASVAYERLNKVSTTIVREHYQPTYSMEKKNVSTHFFSSFISDNYVHQNA